MKNILSISLIALVAFQSCRYDTKMAEPPVVPIEEPEPLARYLPAATKTGWWIRIDTVATESAQILFDIGTNETNARYWLGWNKGDFAEFDVPEKYRNTTDQLYIRAVTNLPGKKAEFCLMNGENGIKNFRFETQQASLQRIIDRDEYCKVMSLMPE